MSGRYLATIPTLTDEKVLNEDLLDVRGNRMVSQGTLLAGENLTDDILKVESRALYQNISADTLIKTGPGSFFGFIVNSHSSGTLKVWDNTSAATTVLLNTITFPAGSGLIYALPIAVRFGVGLYADVGGTIDLTILYQ